MKKTIKKNRMINTKVKITLEERGDAEMTSKVLVMFKKHVCTWDFY